MNRRFTLYVVVALAGLGVAWFFSTFERRLVTERVPPSGEARVRDFLAAERFAERMGLPSRELRSLPELDHLAPGLLLLPNRRASIDGERVTRLLAWVQRGGHLIAEAEPARIHDPLFERLAIQRSPASVRTPALLNIKAVAVDIPNAERKLNVLFPYDLTLTSNANALVRAADEGGLYLAAFHHGKGIITVTTSLAFARNGRIGKFDDAEFLWQLAQLTSAKELQVFFRPERLSLTGFLVQHALPALIAAGVLLALWLWRIAPRFGPVAPDAPPARRRLLDHLRASGRYYWAQGLRARLVLAARDAALRRIARSQPDFSTASLTEKQQRLAALAGIRPEEAAQFLAAGGAMRGGDFIRVVQRAQRVHSALEKGER